MLAAAIVALLQTSSGSKLGQKHEPDVYGPNGDDFKNDSALYDSSRIGINITKKGKGNKCATGDWTTATWIGSLKDGRVVTDTSNEGDNRPRTFALGNDDVWKCFEIAIP